MKFRHFYSALLFASLLGFSAFISGDDDARSFFTGRVFTESDFTPGDSCAIYNPERHDDFTHENGYRASGTGADSCRFVIKLRQNQLPWYYTRVCIGWTRTSGAASLNYEICIYDTTGPGGSPGNLIWVIPGQSISGIPLFPSMIWNSSIVPINVSGPIYVGARWNANLASGILMSSDESPSTPLWPGYRGLGSPPTWETIQSQFTSYRCMCIRAEGYFSGTTIHQADEWCPYPPGIPGSGALWGHASVALGDTLYIAGGGGSGAPSSTFIKYSIRGNTYVAGTSMPGPKTGGDLVACGGKLYYIGGGSTSYSVGTPEQYSYNRTSGTWTTVAPIPTPVTGNVAESYQDSLIYCIAGGWTTYLTTIQVYRVNSNTWTTATSMLAGTGRRSFAGGLLENKIFVCAGYSGVFRQDLQIGTINPANPLSISWTAGPNFSIATSRPGGTAIYGRFYIAVGEISIGGVGNQMGIFDITSGIWLPLVGVKPTPTSNLWGAVSGTVINCWGRWGVKIWVPGGSYTNTNRPLDVFADTCFPIGCSPLNGISQNNKIPEAFSLLQNYPNPFNPSTKISYLLPKASEVTLVVYDLLGREVVTLINEFRTAGTHTVEFNASNLASGVYLYRIEAGDFKDTKKMLLVK